MNFLLQSKLGKRHWIQWVLFYGMFLLFYLLSIKGIRFLIISYAKTGEGSKNGFIAIAFLLYVLLLVTFIVLFKVIYKRKILTVITARKDIDFLRFSLAFVFWGVVAMSFLSIGFFAKPELYKWIFKPEKFFPFLLLCLFFLPIQALFKEIFRAHILQGTSLLVKKRWLILLLVSLSYTLFMFFQNFMATEVNYHLLIFYFATNLMLTGFTMIDDGIEISTGIHFANNLIASVYITSASRGMVVDALYLETEKPSNLYLIYVPILVFYPLFMFVLFKIFKWKNWKEKLLEIV